MQHPGTRFAENQIPDPLERRLLECKRLGPGGLWKLVSVRLRACSGATDIVRARTALVSTRQCKVAPSSQHGVSLDQASKHEIYAIRASVAETDIARGDAVPLDNVIDGHGLENVRLPRPPCLRTVSESSVLDNRTGGGLVDALAQIFLLLGATECSQARSVHPKVCASPGSTPLSATAGISAPGALTRSTSVSGLKSRCVRMCLIRYTC